MGAKAHAAKPKPKTEADKEQSTRFKDIVRKHGGNPEEALTRGNCQGRKCNFPESEYMLECTFGSFGWAGVASRQGNGRLMVNFAGLPGQIFGET
jgi:hypothetical protein